jgi:hypothetical protein
MKGGARHDTKHESDNKILPKEKWSDVVGHVARRLASRELLITLQQSRERAGRPQLTDPEKAGIPLNSKCCATVYTHLLTGSIKLGFTPVRSGLALNSSIS